LLGLMLLIVAAASAGMGNLIIKKMPRGNMIAVVAWGRLFACPPMLLPTVALAGPPTFLNSFQQITAKCLFSLGNIVYLSTWFGYGVWGWLVSRYRVGTIVPFTLLVPVIGMMGAVLFLGEALEAWKVVAAILVTSGLAVNFLGERYFYRFWQMTKT